MNRRFQREIELLQEDDQDIVLVPSQHTSSFPNAPPKDIPPVQWITTGRPVMNIPRREFINGYLYQEYAQIKDRVRYRVWSLVNPDKLVREEWYRRGELNGCERIWTDEGVLTSESHYVDDQLDGRVRLWERGILKLDCGYRRGELHGEYYRCNTWGWPVQMACFSNGYFFGPYFEYNHVDHGSYLFRGWAIGGKIFRIGSGIRVRLNRCSEPCYHGTLLGWSVDMHQHLHELHRQFIRTLFLACHLNFLLTSAIAELIPCAVMGPVERE